jgi:hypothetical protein
MLFAEALVRFLAFPRVFPPTLFVAQSCMGPLFAVSVCLQTVNKQIADPLIFKTRAVVVTFAASVLGDSQTYAICLAGPVFASGFFRFVCETPLRATILILLRHSLIGLQRPALRANFGVLVELFSHVCNSCADHPGDLEYESLAVQVTQTIIAVVRHNPALSPAFSGFILNLLRAAQPFSRAAFLDDLFVLVAYVSAERHRADFPLESVLTAIRLIGRENHSGKVDHSLLGLLGGCANASVGMPFLIRAPGAIPLTFAASAGRAARTPGSDCFGHTPRAEEIEQRIKAQYPDAAMLLNYELKFWIRKSRYKEKLNPEKDMRFWIKKSRYHRKSELAANIDSTTYHW